VAVMTNECYKKTKEKCLWFLLCRLFQNCRPLGHSLCFPSWETKL